MEELLERAHAFGDPVRRRGDERRFSPWSTADRDNDLGNNGGAYRFDDVDVRQTGSDPGEWLEYDIVVTQTGLYRVTAHVTSGCCDNLKSFHLDIDGSDASGPVEFELIDDWDTLHDVVGDGIYLEAGPHRLRFVWDEVPFDLESFDLTLP